MTSDGLGVMFEGDSADTCAEKFPLMSMGGRAEGLACIDPGARTPIGVSGNFTILFHSSLLMLDRGGHIHQKGFCTPLPDQDRKGFPGFSLSQSKCVF